MQSLQQELAAAAVRAEQQASGDGAERPELLQLLAPPTPPRNPVKDGMAAQQASAADEAAALSSWSLPDATAVQVLRRCMWRRAQGGASSQAAPAAALGSPGSPVAAVPTAPAVGSPAAAGSSCSKAIRQRVRAAGSPSLEAMLSDSAGLLGSPLLANGDSPQQQPWQAGSAASQQRQPVPLASPCTAESCASASASMMGDSGGGGGRQQGHSSWPRPLPTSPMVSAAASVMQRFQPQRSNQAVAVQQQRDQLDPGRSTVWPVAAQLPEPISPLLRAGSPAAGSPALRRLDSSGDLAAGSPLAAAGSWRHAATASAGTAASPAGSGSSARRRSARVAFTLTPPRRFDDSPNPSLRQAQQEQQPPPAADAAEATPASKWGGRAGSLAHALQPQQQQQAGSPGSPLLASCLKGPLSLAPSPFALPSPPAGDAPELPASPRWALGVGHSGSLGSPHGSGGRRRSAVVTTSSPLAPPRRLDGTPPPAQPHRLSGGGCAEDAAAAASPSVDELLAGPCRFDSPAISSLSAARGPAPSAGGSEVNDLKSRFARFAQLRHP